ncbi:MAG: phage holin family protein [Thermoanaerobaculia bacterium]
MIRMLTQIVLNGIGILVAAFIVPGIDYQGGLLYLFLVGLVMGLINLLVRPIVTVLSVPLIILTLGLFFFAINGLMLYLAAYFLDGLTIDGCFSALLGGLVLGLFNWLIGALATG